MLRRSPRQTLGHAGVVLAALALMSMLAVGCRQSAPARAQANTVVGVGATFPAPLYTRWAEDYRAASGISVNYQGVGSGVGIQQIQAKTADFGASDIPLTPAELAPAGLYQFPAAVGGITPVVNLPGVGSGRLKLTGTLLGDIYLGDIKRWDDPQILALNPGLKLPPVDITVVHRRNPSGSTYLFTSYLSMMNANWRAKVGAGGEVAWPNGVAGWGNGGVVDAVRQTKGAIGYVEYAYAKQAGLDLVQLQNHDGAFVVPTAQGFAAAAAGADWAKSEGDDVMLLDQPGAGAWPITGATFILVYRQPPKPEKTRQTLAFFDWAYRSGDAAASSLDFVPLPQAAKDLVRKQWAATIKDGIGQPLYAPKS